VGIAASASGHRAGFALQAGSGGIWTANGVQVCAFCLAGGDNDAYMSVVMGDDGDLEVWRFYNGGLGTATLLGTAVGALADPDTLYFLEFGVDWGDTEGAYWLRVDESVVLSGSSMNTGGDISPTLFTIGAQFDGGDTSFIYLVFDDLHLLDTNGAVNNDFLGDYPVVCTATRAHGAYLDWPFVLPAGMPHYRAVQRLPEDFSGTRNINTVSAVAGVADTFFFNRLPPPTTDIIPALRFRLGYSSDPPGDGLQSRIIDSLLSEIDTTTTDYEINPFIGGSTQWTVDDLNHTQFGPLIASSTGDAIEVHMVTIEYLGQPAVAVRSSGSFGAIVGA
jgi:hypothetical protein